MRQSLPLALFIAALPVVAQTGAQRLLAERGIHPIPLSEAAQLFRQCSRAAPEPGVKLWLPSASEVALLEAALPAYLADLKAKGKRTPASSEGFARQYVGFTRGSLRLIYGSYFPSQLVERRAPGAVIVCDGGASVWGLVFDVERRAFSELQLNGPA